MINGRKLLTSVVSNFAKVNTIKAYCYALMVFGILCNYIVFWNIRRHDVDISDTIE